MPDYSSVTPFQARVYRTLLEVPRGKVTTYALLARKIGCGSAQAVGQALRRNPFAPEVPCHRVVRSTLEPGGFSGQAAGPETERKRRLLEAEGVSMCGDKIDPSCLHRFPVQNR